MKRVALKMKDVQLFDLPSAFAGGNTVQPTNDFNEFKKEDIEQSVANRFERQARIYRDKIAVKVADRHLSYGALNRRANRVAHAVLREYDDSRRLNGNEKTRYKRQMMLHHWGIDAQEKLKNTAVFVAGAGGSGSPLIMQLALAGFGTIIICDFDEVELSNLNRQVLHDESRIGMNKALSAAQTVQRINPNVRVIAYSQKITRDNIHCLAANAAIIFDNVDDVEAKFILSQCAVQKGIPHIISSMIDMNAYAAIFHTPHTPCYHCLYDRDVLRQLAEMKQLMKNYQKNPNPVASPALFLSTGFAVNEAVKIVLGFAKERPAYNKFFLFNQRGVENIVDSDGYRQLIYPFSRHFRELSGRQGFDWEKGWRGRFLEEIEVAPDPHCPACGTEKREELEPLPSAESSAVVEPIVVYEPAPDKDKNTHLPTAALLFGHDTDMVIGLMGALKAGKTYVPLDPGYPGERLKYMLEDSEARVIITGNANYGLANRLRERVNRNIAIVNIDEIENDKMEPGENPGISIDPKDLAYILYTSGSTGQPKGVMQNQRNVLHFARVYANALHLNSSDRLTLFSSYGFDAAKMDIYGALLNGGTLLPYDIKKEDGLSRLAQWLEAEGITVYHSIPTVYRYFTDQLTGAENFKRLRLIVLGGEAVFKKDVETYKKYFPADCLFVNGLGPTESTVTLQYFIDKNSEINKEAVPVGYPAAETEVLLLDENDRETEGYGIGEIVYKSDYLALGYLHNREKTDEVFVKNPLTGKDRVYRSGDLGRRLGDGSIEYVGRKDFQVKVRGYRVELQEIEGKMDNMPGIKKSAVICKQDERGESYLTAYYMEANGAEKIDEMRLANDLREMLPDYMVPGTFYRLEKFPLTATGKLDRKALAGLADNQNPSMMEYVEPAEGIESTLAGIWKEALKVEKIGVYDNFFVLGGNSLKAILLTSLLHKKLDAKVSLAEIFRNPTVKELASLIEKTTKEKFTAIEKAEEKEYYGMSSAQERLFILQENEPASIAYNMLIALTLKGSPDRGKMEACFRQLIHRHESLRTSFEMIDDQPVQRIHKNVNFQIDHFTAKERKEGKEGEGGHPSAGIVHDFIRPFDLSGTPLMRVGLLAVEKEEHILLVDMHHIISDAISHLVLVQDFVWFYTGEEPAPLKLQYKDYCEWQHRQEVKETFNRQEAYWLKRFEGKLPILELPLDFPRPPIQNFEGRGLGFQVEKDRAEALKKYALEEGVTLQMLMKAVFHILLFKLSGQEDIITGTTIAGRGHADLEKVIGLFVNTLPIRTFPADEKTFRDYLKEVKEISLTAYENQDYPFDSLVKKAVGAQRDTGRNPIFDIMFEIRIIETGTGGAANLEIPGLQLRPYPMEINTTKFDQDWLGRETNNGMNFSITYAAKLFKQETIQLMIDMYLRLIETITAAPQSKIKDLDCRPVYEKVLTGDREVAFNF